jgi:hypothetical protein
VATDIRLLNWSRIVKTLLLFGIAGWMLYSYFKHRFSFDEEVLLNSGEVIVVHRKVHASPLGEIGGPGGWDSEYQSLQISTPIPADSPPKWETRGEFVPLLFDRSLATGEWVVLVTIDTCDGWHDLGALDHPYGEFRVRSGAWTQTTMSEEWFGRPSNIETGIRSSGEPEILDLNEKKRRQTSTVAARFKSIINNWNNDCKNTVRSS